MAARAAASVAPARVRFTHKDEARAVRQVWSYVPALGPDKTYRISAKEETERGEKINHNKPGTEGSQRKMSSAN